MAAGGGQGQSIWEKLSFPVTVVSGIATVLFLVFEKPTATLIFLVLTFIAAWFWLHPIISHRVTHRGSLATSAISIIPVVCALLTGLFLANSVGLSRPTNPVATTVTALVPSQTGMSINGTTIAQNPTTQPDPITQIAITQIAITQVAVTQVAITQIVATSPPAPSPEPIVATPTSVSTPVNPPISGTFHDDFDTSLGSDWHIIQPGFSFENGNLAGNGGSILYKPKSSNYIIKVKAKIDRSILLFFRLKDIDSISEGYALECNIDYCRWLDLRTPSVGGIYISDYIKSDSKFKSDQYYEFTIEVKGRNYIASIDGKILTSIANESYQSNVVVELEAGGAHIDYFELIPLP